MGLKVDLSCEADDFECVSERVEEYAKRGGKGDVAICWVGLSRALFSLTQTTVLLCGELISSHPPRQKHSYLHKIARELGAKKTAPYPDDRYDIIWTLTRRRIVRKESEQCPGLDPVVRRHDPDLEVGIGEEAVVEEEEEEEEEAEDNESLEDLVFEEFVHGAEKEEQFSFGLNELD